jgi:hypothetical protein
MLGHASAAMTLDVYAGLFGDDLDALADRMDEAAARASCKLSADSAPRSGRSTARLEARRCCLTWTLVWWGGWGSNPRPKDYESSALTG